MSGLLKERFGCARDERGQMTVELAVMIPVLVAIAVIAMNAMLFFSECAACPQCSARVRDVSGLWRGHEPELRRCA